LNTNMLRAATAFIRDNPEKKIRIVPIGRRGRDFFHRRGVDIPAEHVNVTAKHVAYDDAAAIAREVMDLYLDEDLGIDKVFLYYNEFRSVLSQKVTLKQIMPIGGLERGAEPKGETLMDYLYEQPPEQIFARLLPKYIETQVFQALLESTASEHGARMTAMDSASKNASELVDRLTLYANRVRQAAITNEIIEVVGGAQALG
jgi:F-type H+-transporting ATPase subunit gamma